MIRASQRQAAHFVLQKNHLITAATGILELVEALGGLVGGSWLTPSLSAIARLATFQPNDLLRFYDERLLLESILMRGQAYIIPAAQYSLYYAATTRQRKQQLNSEFRLWGIENDEIETLGPAIIDAVGDHPVLIETINDRLISEQRKLTQTSRGGRVTTTTNINLALKWLTASGKLHAGFISKAPQDWQTVDVAYAPLEYWYPDLELATTPDEATAQATLVRTYLTAFGPATEADISAWTGFGKSETARAVAALSNETTLTLVEGIPGMTLLLKNQAKALQAISPPEEPVVNILPADDPFTIAHRASRSRYFADQSLQRQVFTSTGAGQTHHCS